MRYVLLGLLFAIPFSAVAGFSIGSLEWPSDDIQLEHNGWGPQQYWEQPYCDQIKKIKMFLKNTNENSTKSQTFITHKYCNI